MKKFKKALLFIGLGLLVLFGPKDSTDAKGTEEVLTVDEIDALESFLENIYLVGHRGKTIDGKIENTRDALLAALYDKEISIAECDIQLTKDGKIVLYHDTSIGRLEKGQLARMVGPNICDLTYEELQELTPYACLLSDVLDDMVAFNNIEGLDTKLLIELKNSKGENDGLDLALSNLLSAQRYQDIIPFLSFQTDDISFAKNLNNIFPNNEMLLVARSQKELDYLANYPADAPFTGVNIGFKYLTSQSLEDIMSNGLDLMVWTINDTDKLEKLFLKLGPDMTFGLVTDNPPIIDEFEEEIYSKKTLS